MYTSGCPNIQKRCCHSSGSAPALSVAKKFVSKNRSNSSSVSAMVSGGNAKMMRNETMSVIHANSGIRISVMPGARRFRIVMTKLKPAAVVPIPITCSPSTQ